MLIKYKSTSCGPEGSFQPGDLREVPDEHGVELVVGGYAENVTPSAQYQPREQATLVATEQAIAPSDPSIPQPQAGRSAPQRRGR